MKLNKARWASSDGPIRQKKSQKHNVLILYRNEQKYFPDFALEASIQ